MRELHYLQGIGFSAPLTPALSLRGEREYWQTLCNVSFLYTFIHSCTCFDSWLTSPRDPFMNTN